MSAACILRKNQTLIRTFPHLLGFRTIVSFSSTKVDHEENIFADGLIQATYMRREGTPKERESSCGRIIDRPIRPLFPPGFYHELQPENLFLCKAERYKMGDSAVESDNFDWHTEDELEIESTKSVSVTDGKLRSLLKMGTRRRRRL